MDMIQINCQTIEDNLCIAHDNIMLVFLNRGNPSYGNSDTFASV